ncbi:MAG TPA: hypothetical protein VFT06_05345, partial [Flavisolibacter sp.]|nr:hypothetical protein [Flavisolibacter sp.]
PANFANASCFISGWLVVLFMHCVNTTTAATSTKIMIHAFRSGVNALVVFTLKEERLNCNVQPL